jgi:hypothetical protein
MSTDTSEDIVRLTTAPNPPTAHLWEQSLAAAGIRSQVVGDYLDAGIGDIPGVQPEIWVHRDDLDWARAVLREKHPLEEDATTRDAREE